MRALLLALVLVAATLTVAPSASAGCPSNVGHCDEEARELVDFLLGGPFDCWDPDHPLLQRLCWGP